VGGASPRRFNIKHKKSDRDIIRNIPCRHADVSPPANRFLASQSQAFPYAFADPSANEIWSSVPISSLDEHTIANFG